MPGLSHVRRKLILHVAAWTRDRSVVVTRVVRSDRGERALYFRVGEGGNYREVSFEWLEREDREVDTFGWLVLRERLDGAVADLEGTLPPCTCIPNALMENSLCPHHGDEDDRREFFSRFSRTNDRRETFLTIWQRLEAE